MIVEIVTACAAAITHSSSFPQLVKTIRTRSTRDISLHFLIQLIVGLSLWEVYGIMRQDPIFIAGNSVGLSFWATVLVIKLGNRKKEKEMDRETRWNKEHEELSADIPISPQKWARRNPETGAIEETWVSGPSETWKIETFTDTDLPREKQ